MALRRYFMVAGAVILYNPDDVVIQNIESYIGNLQKLYVVDNSDLYNKKVIDFCNRNSTIVYIDNRSNLGVAKALNLAAYLASANGYDWLLTMDQDSLLKPGFFKVAEAPMAEKKNVIIAASYNNAAFRPQRSAFPGFMEVSAVITSGNLLNLAIWKTLGGFCEKLFIDEVDNEFCSRAVRQKYKVQATNDIYLEHNLGVSYTKINILTKRTLKFTMHSPVRLYYMTRNNLFLWKRYWFTDPGLVYNRLKNLVKLIFEITFYYPDKLKYYKKILKGTYHFFTSKYGKL
jgi:rhamnosyltransferase